MTLIQRPTSSGKIGQVIQKIKDRIHRLQVHISEKAWDPDFKVQRATTKEDLEAVFHLQHQSFVIRGLMKPQPSKLRCNLFHFLPQTQHIVVKYKNRLIASATLVADSRLGVPSDKYFEEEILRLRAGGTKVVEISSVVIDSEFHKQADVINDLLMKYSFRYARSYMDGSVLIMAVHPARMQYYQRRWLFFQGSQVVQYHSGKNAQSTLMIHSLAKTHRRRFLSAFPSTNVKKNIALFMMKRDPRFIYPRRRRGQTIDPVMTPELLEYFFMVKTNLYEDLDFQSRQIFLEMYLQFYGEKEIGRFLDIEREVSLKEYRIPMSTHVTLEVGSQKLKGRLRDLTTNGCFVEISQEIHSEDAVVSLTFDLGSLEIQTQGKLLWRNKKQLMRYKPGYGIRFETPILEVQAEIRNWLPSRMTS